MLCRRCRRILRRDSGYLSATGYTSRTLAGTLNILDRSPFLTEGFQLDSEDISDQAEIIVRCISDQRPTQGAGSKIFSPRHRGFTRRKFCISSLEMINAHLVELKVLIPAVDIDDVISVVDTEPAMRTSHTVIYLRERNLEMSECRTGA